MQLPTDTRAATGLRAEPVTLRGTVVANGTCTLTSRTVPTGYRWLVNYLTVTTTGSAAPVVTVYVNSADPANILDGTSDGRRAVAPYVPARVLTQGQTLVAVWVGAAAGATCSLRIEYELEEA